MAPILPLILPASSCSYSFSASVLSVLTFSVQLFPEDILKLSVRMSARFAIVRALLRAGVGFPENYWLYDPSKTTESELIPYLGDPWLADKILNGRSKVLLDVLDSAVQKRLRFDLSDETLFKRYLSGKQHFSVLNL